MAEEPTEIDLAPFIAAMIENAGGEVRLPFGLFADRPENDRAIAIDIEDDGATIVLSLVDGVPNE